MAGYSINRIPATFRTFVNGQTLSPVWTSNQMDVFQAISSVSRYDNIGSIKCQIADVPTAPSVTYNGTVVAESKTVVDDASDYIETFVWIKSDFNVTVNARTNLIHSPTSVSIFSDDNFTQIVSAEWTLIRCKPLLVPVSGNLYDINFTLNFSNFDTATAAANYIYISFPVTYSQSEFLNNPSILDIFLRLPETMRSGSLNETTPSLSLIRFIELACASRGRIFNTITTITPRDISEGYLDSDNTTKSILVDPDVVIRKFAFWLAQFVGTRLINPQVSVTPWGNIPSTWQGVDLMDSIDSASDSATWQVVQSFLPEIYGLDEYYRWQIDTAYHGYAAGTQEALREAVKRVLTGTKYTNITFSGFTCTYQTKKSETPGAQLISVGNPVPEIVEIIEATRPAGFVVNHQLVA